MTTNERTLRTLTGVLAVLIIAALGHPFHAASQDSDLVAQGRQALDAGRVDEAIALFERAVAADAKSPARWPGSAAPGCARRRSVPMMERAGWVSRGFDTLDEAVERFPEAWIVYLVRGLTAVNLPADVQQDQGRGRRPRPVVAMKDRAPQVVPDAVMGAVFLNLGLAEKNTRGHGPRRAPCGRRAGALYPDVARSRRHRRAS